MKNRRLLIVVGILALLTLSCGLPAGLLGGDDGDAADAPPDAGGSEDAEVASLDTLDSYRVNMTWRAESEDGSEDFVMTILQEWVKGPPKASRFVLSGAGQDAESVPLMEFIAVGDSGWMRVGDTWVESNVETVEGMSEAWGGMWSDDAEGWEYVDTQTANGVQCRRYKSTETTTTAFAAPDEGGTVQVSIQGETWVADQAGLPRVPIRERVQIEGGFFPFPIGSGADAPQTPPGTFYLEYDVTDINTDIVINPPGQFSAAPAPPAGGDTPAAEPPAGQAPAGETPGAAPPLPPPPAETQTKVRAADGMIMVYIPLGQFLMGDDNSAFAPERPGHIVYLDGFWIDQTEVTNAQYRLCVEAGACTPPGSWDRPELAGDQQPALGMWPQAQAYCQWVGGRLPTEAEWEKAARGTDGRLWPWGNQFEDGRANLTGDLDGHKHTAPVGMFPAGASPYGLQDMAGNAGEWVADWYSADYYGQSPGQNPTGPAGGEKKVHRSTIANGGGGPEKCRTVARYPAVPEATAWIYGFRCASTTQP